MIRLINLTLFAPLLASNVALAEPQPAVQELMHYMDGTAACFDAAMDEAAAEACIGQGSAVCMDTEEGGYTTIGMMFCAWAEFEEWDRLLNREYASVMDGMRAIDAQEAGLFPEFAVRAERLRDAQRAWIVMRDAECSLQYAMWGAGSMRQIAGATCKLQETGERTLYLRFLGDYMR